MALVEKGTPFSEQIDVDEQQDAEVFRVPRHNDFEGADFYHDFKMVSVKLTLNQNNSEQRNWHGPGINYN